MKIVRIGLLASVLALAPFAWSPARGLKANEACGFADCCAEKGSTCVRDDKATDNAYYTSGSCPKASLTDKEIMLE